MPERKTGYIPQPRPELSDLIAGRFKEAEQKDLAGRYAVITGASRGIGEALAIQAALRGIDGLILVSTPSSREELGSVAHRVSSLVPQTMSVAADITDTTQAAEIYRVAKIVFDDKPAIIINNAGVIADGSIHEQTVDEWQKPIDVKLRGAFNVTTPFIRDWAQRFEEARSSKTLPEFEKPGTIVFVGSIVAKIVEDPDAEGSFVPRGNAKQSSYVAANAGVMGLAQTIRREFDRRMLTSVTVLPGFVTTRMTDTLPEAVKKMALRTLNGTALDPHEIAHEILNAAMYAQNGAVVEIVK